MSFSARTLGPPARLALARLAVGVTVTKHSQLRGLLKGVRSRPVLARKPPSRPGRYCMRLSRVLIRAVSWARLRLARLARDRFRCDQTGSTGFSSCAYGGSRAARRPPPPPERPGVA